MAKGMGNIMKQAQQMQAKIARVQQELETKEVEATAGGGMVTARVNGKQEVLSLTIEKDVVTGDLTEGSFTLASQRGKVVWFNIFSSW